MKKKFAVALIIHLIFLKAAFAQNKDDSNRAQILDELETRLQENADKENVGSMTAVVIDGGQVLWSKHFGWIDKEKKNSTSSKSIYLIGSISKSVTGVALAKLVEQNVLKLDDPIEKYLPEIKQLKNLPPDSSPITFRQLATHTAGLAREPELPEAAVGPIEEWENKVLAAIATTSLISRPGEKYSYSNIGYGILGLAMSRATAKPFDQLIQEMVFIPLQMSSSGFVLSPDMEKNLAVSYAGTRDYHLGRGYKYPNGGVYATLEDMVNFTKTQLHTHFEDYLSDSLWKEVQSFQVVTHESNDEKYGYGLGVSVWTDKNQRKWVYHNGIVAPGYSAAMYCDLSSKMGIVILRNDNGSDDIFGIADEFLYRLAETKSKK